MKYLLNLSIIFSFPILSLAQNHADCDSAYQVCDKNRLHFVGQSGEGANKKEAFAYCFMNAESLGNPEKNSVWIRFDIQQGGLLTFVIVPDTLSDDIDFVVFMLSKTGNCARKRVVRCMAAGDIQENFRVSPCMGATGLNDLEKDENEDAGCTEKGDNNWLAPLKVKAGEKYALLVSNITVPYNGFKIQFGGTATFACDTEKE